MNTSPIALELRKVVREWLRSAIEAAVSGPASHEFPPPPEFLSSELAPALPALQLALKQARLGNWEEASRVAAEAVEHTRGQWPEGFAASSILRSFPALIRARQMLPATRAKVLSELRAEWDLLETRADHADRRTQQGETRQSPRADPNAGLRASMALLRIIQLQERLETLDSELPRSRVESLSALEKAAAGLEELVDGALVLDLDGVRREAGRLLLSTLTSAVRVAMRNEDWKRAAQLRGWYFYRWEELREPGVDRFGGEVPELTFAQCRAMGEVARSLHDINFIHGTLLPESFGWNGAVKNFGQTERLEEFDVHAVAEDLRLMRHQLSPSQWAAFASGYWNDKEIERTRVLFNLVETTYQSEIAATKLPNFTPLLVPDYSVRACGYALAHFYEARVDFAGQLQATVSLSDAGKRARDLAALARQAHGVDTATTSMALRYLVATIQELRDSGDSETTLAVCDWVRRRIAGVASASQRAFLEAVSELTLATLCYDSNEAADHLRHAGEILLRRPGRGIAHFARRVLLDGLEGATDGSLQAVIVRLLLHGEIEQAAAGSISDLRSLIELLPVPEHLTPPAGIVLRAYLDVAAALLLSPERDPRPVLAQAKQEMSAEVPELSALHALLDVWFTSDTHKREMPPVNDRIHSPLSAEAYALIARRDWERAAALLERELEQAEEGTAPPLTRLGIASALAATLQNASDFFPARHFQLSHMVAELVERYEVPGLELAGQVPITEPGSLAATLSSLGWAGVWSFEVNRQLESTLLSSRRLLETAMLLTPRASDRRGFSVRANNLALAYRASGTLLSKGEERIAVLERAAGLLKEVAEVDRELAASRDPDDRQVGETLYLDYFNYGLVAQNLARATDDKTWLSERPLASAKWYREAINSFALSRDLARDADRPENSATAELSLAGIGLDLCEDVARHRIWAGGDIKHGFYKWLSEISGGPARLATFVQLCAEGAIAGATAAATVGISRNPALMLESLELLIQVLRIGEIRDGLPPAVARHALLSVVELLQDMQSQGAIERHFAEEEAEGELEELKNLLEALLRVEFFQTGHAPASWLQEAHARFVEITRTGGTIHRALARPRASWLNVSVDEQGVLVNGLYIGAAAGDLEIRIPSQHRRLLLRGLAVQHIDCEMITAASVRERALGMAHLTAHLEWNDMPPSVPISVISAFAEGAKVRLSAARLPATAWESWVLQVSREGDGEIRFAPSLPFLGLFDPITQKLVTASPELTTDATGVLVFGQAGLTLEISPPFGTTPEGGILAERIGDEILVRTALPTVLCSLKSTPRVAMSEVGFLVRDDHPLAGACCSASYSLDSPGVMVNTAVVRTFAPLFFFYEEIAEEAVDFVNGLDLHEIVLVGIPSAGESLDAALDRLYDPRRELFMIVEETEKEAAVASIDRFRQRLSSRVGARLLDVAASAVDDFDPRSSIQLVVVPRSESAAAAQMLLDLATIRRRSIDQIPLLIEGRPTFVELVGNPVPNQRQGTLLPSPSTWADLVSLYLKRVEEPLGKLVHSSESYSEVMRGISLPHIPRRPCMILPDAIDPVLALLPYVRQLGALILPDTSASYNLCARLQPRDVYLTAGTARALPEGSWNLHVLPTSVLAIASDFQKRATEAHDRFMATLESDHPELLASRGLFDEMKPDQYVVVSVDSVGERAWCYVAANYAAALGVPLIRLGAESAADDEVRRLGSAILAGSALRGNVTEQSYARNVHVGHGLKRIPGLETPEMTRLLELLESMNPTFVGVVSSQGSLPFELLGDPPLAVRFAVGRLAGPDLSSTSILITRAALSENVDRPATLIALLAAADTLPDRRPLPGARKEVQSVAELLGASPGFSPLLVSEADDLAEFSQALSRAHLVHFAGHGHYDAAEPSRSGLVFRNGTLTPEGLSIKLSEGPLVFSNACESAVIRSDAVSVDKAWTGLAAAFIRLGATNYLGSLWPIFDASSQRLAECFYSGLLKGLTVGEALREGRREVRSDSDPTWAAFVLFGCPRSRLRAQRSPNPDLQG